MEESFNPAARAKALRDVEALQLPVVIALETLERVLLSASFAPEVLISDEEKVAYVQAASQARLVRKLALEAE